MDSESRECRGPVYFGDQGIEWCEECGECLCCMEDTSISHERAVYLCWRDSEGICALKGNPNHPNHVCDEEI